MTVYVVTRRDSDEIETPVFHAGDDDQYEAIAVFSAEALARQYIQDAGWEGACEVGALNSLQLLRWLVEAHDQGTQFAVADPKCHEHVQGQLLPVVNISKSLAQLAELLEHAFI